MDINFRTWAFPKALRGSSDGFQFGSLPFSLKPHQTSASFSTRARHSLLCPKGGDPCWKTAFLPTPQGTKWQGQIPSGA